MPIAILTDQIDQGSLPYDKGRSVFSKSTLQRIAVFAIFALPACSGGVASTQVPATGNTIANTTSGAQRLPQGSRALAASCGAATSSNGTCTNVELATTTIYGPTTPAQQVPGLHPADLQSAYSLPSALAGSGQTIAVVVANADPNAESDLAVYRSTFGLPPCTSASGCFRVVALKIGRAHV